MNNLDKLIQQHTAHAVVTAISGATERLAEELAREMLKDPETRAELQRAVRSAFGLTMNGLRATPKTKRARPRKGGR